MPENARCRTSDDIVDAMFGGRAAGRHSRRSRGRSRGTETPRWLVCVAVAAGAIIDVVSSSTAVASVDGHTDSGASPPLVVALDPGHGGSNLGAAGPGRGLFEKHITLALAERVRELLQQPAATAVPLSIVLCRGGDVMVPIRARSRCARDSGAALFISLHANAVPAGVPAGTQRGFEVFVLGPREVEDDATLGVIGREDDAEAVWAAHEVRAAAERSIILGATLAGALTRALGRADFRGVKQAGAALDVLRGTGTAAALVEVGFLDHPVEGRNLATPDGREPIARALADAVKEYARVTSLRPPPDVAGATAKSHVTKDAPKKVQADSISASR